MNVLEMVADILEDSPAISPDLPLISPAEFRASLIFSPLSPDSPTQGTGKPTKAVGSSKTCWDCRHMDKSGVFFPGLCRRTGEEVKPEIVDTGCQSFSPAPLLTRAMGYGCGGCHCKTYLRTPAGWQCEGCGFVYEVIGGTVGPLPIRWN